MNVEPTTGSDTATGARLLARVERIPLTRFHLRVASILGVGTFSTRSTR
ncbi:hypothetical protein [Amycolatopsis albispora]|nr:hypothetical protein [Amycolatopsis albispora]